MSEKDIKKLPLKHILLEAWQYCKTNARVNVLLVVVAYIVGVAALSSWKSVFFWPLLVIIYGLWGTYFRYYFGRKPVFDMIALANSLVPSTKIVVLSVVIVSLLIVLPMLPLFINITPEFNLAYARFLQGDFEQKHMLILITDVVFLFISPVIVYRPFLAWISALAGRSGSLRFAWSKTRGNYVEFLLLAVVTNFSLVICRWFIIALGGNDYITMLLAAPLFVYFNVVSAKAYEFFFLEIDD